MNLNFDQFRKSILFLAFFTLIPLWNIPHTIAARYVCEALVLIVTIFYKPDWKLFFKKNMVLLIFFVYLFIQLLFFSENFKSALSNFRSEWMHFILFSIIGAGVGLILGKRGAEKILLYLGIAFSIPLFIHLLLSFIKGISIERIPWGYWGISETHGDLGYTALQAVILLLTYYLYQAKDKAERYLVLSLILICFASPFLASSRGGVGFIILSLIFITVFHFLIGPEKKISAGRKLLISFAIALSILAIWKAGEIVDPKRWSANTLSRLSAGLEAKPSTVFCKSTSYPEEAVKQKVTEINPTIQKNLDNIIDGDGSRVVAARFGLMLTLKNFMGIDQSRQAFVIAVDQYCNNNSQISISHSHNAWIDTALAIGIPGAVLLLLVMLKYAKLGYGACSKKTINSPFGVALLASAVIWILRGIIDSTMRDQMLEMQAFILSLLLGILLAEKNDSKK